MPTSLSTVLYRSLATWSGSTPVLCTGYKLWAGATTSHGMSVLYPLTRTSLLSNDTNGINYAPTNLLYLFCILPG